MKKKIVLSLLFVIGIVTITFAQVDRKKSLFKVDKTDLGLGFSTAFYLGDFNEYIPLSNPRYYANVHHRYSFDMIYALRTSVGVGAVANKINSNKIFMPHYTEKYEKYGGLDVRFERTFIDFNTGVEINFRAFDALRHKVKQTFAPYMFLGIGLMLMYPDKYRDEPDALQASQDFPKYYGTNDDNSSSIQSIYIPLAVGIKWSPKPRWTLAFEWQFRKTFTDGIDRFDNTVDKSGFMNSDWVSTLGVNVSYRLVPKRDCPNLQPPRNVRKNMKGLNRSYSDYDKKHKKKRK